MHIFSNHDNFYHKIYHESNKEFEEIRELCLSENGWLNEIYTRESLVLEKHIGYSVVFDKTTHEPVGMAGLFNDGRYPQNVARHLHREYLFPKYRQHTMQGIVNAFSLYQTHIIEPLNSLANLDCCFIGVQNRYKKKSKGYWKVFSSAATQGLKNFVLGEGYIQTCPHNVQKCWQNYIYCENVIGAWGQWDKQIIDHEQWLLLDEGN